MQGNSVQNTIDLLGRLPLRCSRWRPERLLIPLRREYALATKPSTKINKTWKKPAEGFLMINVDGSFEETTSTGSTGAIIRDSSGGFIAASYSYISNVLDAHMAEASALRDGLLLAQRLVLANYKIQADCMEVVDTMLEGGYSATASAAIYDECSQLWEDFDAISISHCNRESNVVAHELARQAMLEKNSCVWIDDPQHLSDNCW